LDLIHYTHVNFVGNLGADGVVGLDLKREIISCLFYCHKGLAKDTIDLILFTSNNRQEITEETTNLHLKARSTIQLIQRYNRI